MTDLENELKTLIIEALNLEGVAPEDIERDAPLFGEGLGLDSIDALELGLALQKKYKIVLDEEMKDIRGHFSSVANLAQFVAANLK